MPNYKHGHRPTVGVLAGWHVYEGVLHSFLDPVLRGVQLAARERGCNLLLACGVTSTSDSYTPRRTVSVPSPEADYVPPRSAWPVPSLNVDFVPVGPWNTDGLIVITPLLSQARSAYIQEVINAGHPVVFLGGGERGAIVDVDNAQGIREAVAHLFQHGHHQIAFIAGHETDASDSGNRVYAYQTALSELGLALDNRLIAYGHHNLPFGRKAMRQILDSGAPFTAVMASNDESAFGALQVLREAGQRVPEDVAVIGFDNRLETVAQTPPLTSVHCPAFEMGYNALLLLLESIEGPGKDDDLIQIPMHLVVRQSCGCQSNADTSAMLWTQPAFSGDSCLTELEVAERMAEAVLAEVRHLSPGEILSICQSLVEAFALSLEQEDGARFQTQLESVLQRVELEGDDTHVWDTALSFLEVGMSSLWQAWAKPVSDRLIPEMMRQARLTVGQSARRQYGRYLVQQRSLADQVGLLTAHLLTAPNETQILEVLAEELPAIGIRQSTVAFFEAEGDDPVAWSRLPMQAGAIGETISRRFPSRDFPPPDLCSPEEPFRLALLPLLVQEDVSGFVAFETFDLTPCATIVRQLAAALKSVQLYQEAAEGRRLAEESNRLKSRLLSTVSHELRTPLSLIVGLSEILLREQKTGGSMLQEDVERIHASAQHLDDLIQDVLDLARGEVGQLKLNCERLDLGDVLRVVAVAGEQMAAAKGLSWQADIPTGLPRTWADPTRLRQVALNLVNNAVKFTAQGEVTLRVRVEGGRIVTTVSDTGLGIPLAEQSAIFDEFRQSERTTARGYGGLGLGLAICKRLVALHGGEIGVTSSGEEGQGSSFYFRLPVLLNADLSSAEIALRSQTVLVVAERSQRSERLREHLIRQGFEVEEQWVEEMDQWLSQVFARPPGQIVLGGQVVSEKGWEILKVLKANPATQEIPVLFYSLAEAEDAGSVLQFDYLTKPVGRTELAQALAHLEAAAEASEKEKAILVVDDDPGVLEMHARLVQAQSPAYQVIQARNGREALDLIRQKPPDLVLLDLMMPEVDGFAVLETMQAEETLSAIPVIVLTGQLLTEADMARLNRGVMTVLQKGLFSAEETLAHVEAVLARNHKLGSEAQRLVRKAMASLHTGYAEPISRASLARYVGVSEDYLTRCFRQEMGVTPMVYLNRYRVNQAKALLASGKETVTEVALAVGFSTSKYFDRVFRREVGMSPSEYRRKVQR